MWEEVSRIDSNYLSQCKQHILVSIRLFNSKYNIGIDLDNVYSLHPISVIFW